LNNNGDLHLSEHRKLFFAELIQKVAKHRTNWMKNKSGLFAHKPQA